VRGGKKCKKNRGGLKKTARMKPGKLHRREGLKITGNCCDKEVEQRSLEGSASKTPLGSGRRPHNTGHDKVHYHGVWGV